jgi:DMSO/TMAO reductase YedYZ heme-binding membrane subunit
MTNLWFYTKWALAVGLIPAHLTIAREPNQWSQRMMAVIAGVCLAWAVQLSFQSNVSLSEMTLTLIWFSSALFVLLSEMLMGSTGAWLTKLRGEQWTKEIDYFYLTFAGFGVIASLGKVGNVSQKVDVIPGMLGPMLVATAIILRAIKTRAEIGGWNKAA